jgi:hypothetical protein
MIISNDKGLQGKVICILRDQELSESGKIKALYSLGYSRKQLIEEFHFSRPLVYRILPVKKELQKYKRFEKILMSIIKSTEVVPPEDIIQCFSDQEAVEAEPLKEELAGLCMYQVVSPTTGAKLIFRPVIHKGGNYINWTAQIHFEGTMGYVRLGVNALKAAGFPPDYLEKSKIFLQQLNSKHKVMDVKDVTEIFNALSSS